MAFVPETGIGLPDANSLVSVEFADEYFADRAIAEWGKLTLPQKQEMIVIMQTNMLVHHQLLALHMELNW